MREEHRSWAAVALALGLAQLLLLLAHAAGVADEGKSVLALMLTVCPAAKPAESTPATATLPTCNCLCDSTHTACHTQLCHAAAAMLRLRQALHDANPVITERWSGWHPKDRAHHCAWQHVRCAEGNGPVLRLLLFNERFYDENDEELASSTNVKRPSSSEGPLLPELAAFPALQELHIVFTATPMLGSIPLEWGAPGAFPMLEG